MPRVHSTTLSRSVFSLFLFLILIFGAALPTHTGAAAGSTIIVYDAVGATLPPNIVSVGFQATQTAEFGDYIHLAGTNRLLRTVTVTMSDWAKYSDYASDSRYSANSVSWSHPLTLNIYNVIPATPLNQRGTLIASVTQNISIPWRPESDGSCGTAWKASNGNCYNGLAFNAAFDMSSLNAILPDDIIVGIAYNTQTWGASPLGVDGPYTSLNVGALGTATVGSDDNPDRVFWNTSTAAWYADGGAAGVGVFREDTAWTPNGTINIQVTVATSPTDVYVDPAWGSVLPGQDPDGSGPATIMGYDAFTTIHAGVNAVASGGTVYVAAGTFNEQVILNKGVSLIGAGSLTLIQPTQTTANTFALYNRKFGGPVNTTGIIITDTTEPVTVSNLKVDGYLVTSVPAGADGFTGILFRGNPGTINTVTVADIHDAGSAAGLGVYLSGFNTSVTVTVNNSTITGYGKNGITANFANLNAVLTGNTITGMGPTSSIAQNGIQMGYGATGSLNNNTISGHVWTGTYGGSNDPATDVEADGASGILLYMPGSGIEILNNTLTGNQFGIWTVAAPSVNIHDNTVTGLTHTANAYPAAIAIWSADMWTVDMGGSETATAATITNNTISTNDYGVLVRDYTSGGAVPSAALTGNHFSNDATHALFTGDSVFDTAAALSANTFDKDATVNHSGALLKAIWGKIQPAINAAVAGDTVNISAGTFTENVTVDESVTLAGSGEASTIIQPAISNPNCGGVPGGSICAGGSNVILVQADDVVIHDLTVDGDNPALAGGINVGGANVDARNGIITNHLLGLAYNGLEVFNVTVENIYLRGIYASSGGSFNFHNDHVANVQGESASIAIFAFGGTGTIADNVVTDANDAIAANWSDGIQFLHNTVSQSSTGIHTDNAGSVPGDTADLIHGNTISNCKADGYGIFVFVPYLGPTVDGNMITGCSVGLSAWGQAEVVTSQFTNNSVTGPAKAADSVGAYIATDQLGYGYNDVSVLFSSNQITNFETGVLLTADAQTWTPGWVSKTVNATFHLNQIYGNTHGMSKGTTGTYINDFEKNWWGSPSGPGPVGLGSGDSISANVDYSPWCTNPECTTFAPPFATRTTITADTPDPSLPGQTVTISATVAGLPVGALTPTGTVIVFEGVAGSVSGQIGPQAAGTYCTITLDHGAGSCDLTFLTTGVKTITALYTPDNTAEFTSSSDTETHTVEPILFKLYLPIIFH